MGGENRRSKGCEYILRALHEKATSISAAAAPVTERLRSRADAFDKPRWYRESFRPLQHAEGFFCVKAARN